ncbi:MAG: TonB-dependent receptor [Candidatus Zixiibacteriota bacterium]
MTVLASSDLTDQKHIQDKNIADMDIDELVQVRISPFDVSAYLDKGYQASNSVSGSRFDCPIRDLPFAIQAFTESFIKDQKPGNIFDIARYSPGVTYRSNDFNEGNANLAIRGFAISSTRGNTQILRDGLQGPSIFDFTNISRVEIVKGPASFLYGQVAPGGIVNIITKSPLSENQASATIKYGSYNEYRFDIDVTGPATQNLFYRLAASYDEDIHYWDPYDAYSRNVSPSLLWQPDKRISISLKFEHFYKMESPQVMQKPGYSRQSGVVPTTDDPNLAGVDVPGLPDNWNSMSYVDFRRSETNNLSTWIDIKANSHWNMRIAYSHIAYIIDALFSGNFGMANNMTFLQGRRFRGQTYRNRGDTYDIQAVGRYNFERMSLRLLFGAQYIDRTFHGNAAQAPNDSTLGSDPTESPLPLWDLRNPSTWNRNVTIPQNTLTEFAWDQTTDYIDKSYYGGATFGFFKDRLVILAGVRQTETENRFTDHLNNFLGQKLTADAATPQFGVLYKPMSGISIYSSYAKSFVPGSQILVGADGTTAPAIPMKGKGYDIGVKVDFLDQRISSTFTVFDIRNQNIINDLAHTDTMGAVVIYNVQSGEQRSRGFEWDITLSPSRDWQFYLSYSYMDTKIVEFSDFDDSILALDPYSLDDAGQQNYKNVYLLHGAPLQMSAPHIAHVWTRYNIMTGKLIGLYVAGGIDFVADQTLLPDSPEHSRQTYTLVNATIGYSWTWLRRQVTLDVTAKNITDAYYRPSQSSRCRPREFLLTMMIGL